MLYVRSIDEGHTYVGGDICMQVGINFTLYQYTLFAFRRCVTTVLPRLREASCSIRDRGTEHDMHGLKEWKRKRKNHHAAHYQTQGEKKE